MCFGCRKYSEVVAGYKYLVLGICWMTDPNIFPAVRHITTTAIKINSELWCSQKITDNKERSVVLLQFHQALRCKKD